MALNGALKGLADCLDHKEIAEDAKLRRAALDQLLDATIWDIEIGGVDLAYDVLPEALFRHLTPADALWVREKVSAAQEPHRNAPYGAWSLEAYEDLLSELDELEGKDPEETLTRLREGGVYRPLFEKLLALNRVEEAVKLVREQFTSAHERLWTAGVLDRAGHGEIAIELARQSLAKEFDDRLAQWLDDRYAKAGDTPALLDLRRRTMRESPSEAAYASLKQAAEALGEWDTTRADVRRELETGERFKELTLVYLHDEEWDAAWKTLARTRDLSMHWGMSRLDLEVANRSRHARPERALPVYIEAARREIEGRSRDHYAQAAAYLKVVYGLYEQIGDEETWLELIAGLREEFRTLRALQDELNKAGL
jgi:hypothetical protein